MKYNIDTFKKIIEINKELINFYVKFKISSKNNKPFYMGIADISDEYELKYVENGKISGDFKWDKNNKREFYLVLRAEEAVEVNVELIINDLKVSDLNKSKMENNMDDNTDLNQEQPHTNLEEIFEEEEEQHQQMMHPSSIPDNVTEQPKDESWLEIILGYKYTILALIVAGIVYYVYTNPDVLEKVKTVIKLPETKLNTSSLPTVSTTPKLSATCDSLSSKLEGLKI